MSSERKSHKPKHETYIYALRMETSPATTRYINTLFSELLHILRLIDTLSNFPHLNQFETLNKFVQHKILRTTPDDFADLEKRMIEEKKLSDDKENIKFSQYLVSLAQSAQKENIIMMQEVRKNKNTDFFHSSFDQLVLLAKANARERLIDVLLGIFQRILKHDISYLLNRKLLNPLHEIERELVKIEKLAPHEKIKYKGRALQKATEALTMLLTGYHKIHHARKKLNLLASAGKSALQGEKKEIKSSVPDARKSSKKH